MLTQDLAWGSMSNLKDIVLSRKSEDAQGCSEAILRALSNSPYKYNRIVLEDEHGDIELRR